MDKDDCLGTELKDKIYINHIKINFTQVIWKWDKSTNIYNNIDFSEMIYLALHGEAGTYNWIILGKYAMHQQPDIHINMNNNYPKSKKKM